MTDETKAADTSYIAGRLVTFLRGKPPGLFITERRGVPLFCRADRRGAGRKTPPPLPEEVAFARTMAAVRLFVRRHLNRQKGTLATRTKAASLRAEIQAYALSIKWPNRGTGAKVTRHFALRGDAPKHLWCSARTVKKALAALAEHEG